MSEIPQQKFRFTDVWNGECFANMHADRFRYLVDREVWLIWDGRRWRDATEGELIDAAKEVAKMVFALATSGEDKGAYAWATYAASRKGIGAMLYFGASEKVFAMRRSQFDTHPHLLNCSNGTLDLLTGQLRPHTPDDFLTTLTEIEFDPDAKCERWDRFLREVFVRRDERGKLGPDEELVSFVQRAVGYSLTGLTREHAFFILHGVGRNGKSVFIRRLHALLGDCARATRFETFTRISSTSINTPSIAALAGARLVSSTESDEGLVLSEGLIKQLTGSDVVEAMHKFERPFNFVPSFKIWLATNHRPGIRGTDAAIWARPRLIPFLQTFDAVEIDGEVRDMRDLKLDDKLDEEMAGVLAWAVRGAMQWYRSGLGMAPAVREATDAYRAEQDVIGAFLEECAVIDPVSSISASDLQELYLTWCKKNGTVYPLSPATLRGKIDGRGGVSYRKTKSGRFYIGMRSKTLTELAKERTEAAKPQLYTV